MQDPFSGSDAGCIQEACVAAVSGVVTACAEQKAGQDLHHQHQAVATGSNGSLELAEDVVQDGVGGHRQVSKDMEFLVLLF